MRWSREFEAGFSDIDDQHRQLFALILRMEQLDDVVARSELHELVAQVAQLSRCHFDCEAWLMSAYDYPEAAKHMADHAKLMQEIHGYLRNEVFRPRKFAQVLSNWLISHTMFEDRPLARYIEQVRATGVEVTVAPPAADAFAKTASDIGLMDNIDFACDYL